MLSQERLPQNRLSHNKLPHLGKRAQLAFFFVFFLFAFWVAYAFVYGKGGVIERKKVMVRIELLRDEIEQLESGSRHLDRRIENLRTDSRAVESYARELGFKKEGEVVYRFLKKDPETRR
jgi:cell division protein FtsB